MVPRSLRPENVIVPAAVPLNCPDTVPSLVPSTMRSSLLISRTLIDVNFPA